MPEIPILHHIYERVSPAIDRALIPAEQMPAFLHINSQLAQLTRYERQFLLAVHLYQYSHQAAMEILSEDFAKGDMTIWTTGGWQSIAARDGALSIYHFGRALEGLRANFRSCPALENLVDHPKIRQAYKDFLSAFPHFIEIRHAVAHLADSQQTMEKKLFNSAKGIFNLKWFSSNNPDAVTWMAGNMNNEKFAVTLEGKAYAYALSVANAQKIRTLRFQIFSAFDAAVTTKPEA